MWPGFSRIHFHINIPPNSCWCSTTSPSHCALYYVMFRHNFSMLLHQAKEIYRSSTGHENYCWLPMNLKRPIVHILITRALSSWLSLWLLVNTALPIWSILMCESLPVSVLELICSCIRPYKMEICVLILVEMQRSTTTTTTTRACLAKSILIYSSRANTSNL